MPTTVVNIHDGATYDIYIGRTPRNIFSDPFRNRKGRSDDEIIADYWDYLWENPEVMKAALTLKGKVLGCYCKPMGCHGDVLAEVADCFTEHDIDTGQAPSCSEAELSWAEIQRECEPLPPAKRIWELP